MVHEIFQNMEPNTGKNDKNVEIEPTPEDLEKMLSMVPLIIEIFEHLNYLNILKFFFYLSQIFML